MSGLPEARGESCYAMFNGHIVSVLQDEKALDICCTTMCVYLTVLYT